MAKIDIFSGFLGAGKTTLIRKLIKEGYQGEKIVLIENEFGEIAVDGGFLKDAGVQITEMNSGCICCTLVGDFTKALQQVVEQYQPDRIIIEPSGVGKLSDVSKAVERVDGLSVGAKVTIVDAQKCRMYIRNFGEFFNDQVENADLIVLSRTGVVDEKKTLQAVDLLRGLNAEATIMTTPWEKLDGAQIRDAMDRLDTLAHEMENLKEKAEHEHHHHHDEDDECCCGHHHDEEHHHHHDDDDECCCGHHHDEKHHHHHDDDDECCCGHHHDEEHHHHHDDDDECCCGHHHDGEHHHHHHADEVFTSWGMETARKYSEEQLANILEELDDNSHYGTVLRAKGIVDASDGEWLYFDYVPGESEIRRGIAGITGRFCVIGSKLNETALKELFDRD